MAQYVTCGSCKAYFALPDPTTGQQARCPACLIPFDGPLAQSGSAGPASRPNKTVLAESEAMVRYTCPRCKKALESPASFAGEKLNCPGCNQRLQIPKNATPAPAPPINKTILAMGEAPSTEVEGASSPREVSKPPHDDFVHVSQVELVETVLTAVAAPPTEREGCLECGADIGKRKRIQTCGDCGSLFCSAQCYREHRYHAHDKRKKKRTRDVECEHCGSTARPYITSQISEGGWVMFAVLLIFFFPLCWLGLLMTETRVKCFDCGRRLE